MKLYEVKEQLKSIGSDNYSDNLNYMYFYTHENGDLIYDTLRNIKYGNSRKGYEQFKQQETNDIAHSGEVSLRAYKRTDSNGDIVEVGYVEETKTKVLDIDRQKKLDELEASIWIYFCEVFNIDNPIKENLVKNIIVEILYFETNSQIERIKWYITHIEDKLIFSGEELDNITQIFEDIGNLKLEGVNNEAN